MSPAGLAAIVVLAALVGCERNPKAATPQSATRQPASKESSPAVVEPPNPPSGNEGRAIESNDRAFRVTYSTTPAPIPMNDPFVMEARIEPISDATNADLILQIDAAMPEHGHGMNVEPRITARGEGRFIVEGMLFHMPGRWEIYFDVTRAGVTSRAQDEIVLE